MSNLFTTGSFRLHSGRESNFKIECDALTDEDWETIARLISENIPFMKAVGVPRGGLKLAEKLEKYADSTYSSRTNLTLVVDDVLTTGKSMEEMRDSLNITTPCRGIVLFARGECPDWVIPIFKLSSYLGE